MGDNIGKDGWINKCYTMEDVQNALFLAKREYELKPRSKAFTHLARFSQRVKCYGTVLDVLAQHHPEYVSLIRGSSKLVFGVGYVHMSCHSADKKLKVIPRRWSTTKTKSNN